MYIYISCRLILVTKSQYRASSEHYDIVNDKIIRTGTVYYNIILCFRSRMLNKLYPFPGKHPTYYYDIKRRKSFGKCISEYNLKRIFDCTREDQAVAISGWGDLDSNPSESVKKILDVRCFPVILNYHVNTIVL